jgi:thiol-disulfide isomerase/thioredoxin
VAAAEEREEAGSESYKANHFGKILEEGFSFSGFERDCLWMNLGGKKFVEVSGVSGIDELNDGRGAAFGDLDNDGDLDVFRTAFQGRSHQLYRNNLGGRNGFVRVVLEGTTCGRDAFGTVVRLTTSQGTQTQIKSGGSGYVSQSDGRLLFGLGKDDEARSIEVTWPNGRVETFGRVKAGAEIRLVEGQGKRKAPAARKLALPDPEDPKTKSRAMLKIKEGDSLPALGLHGEKGRTATLATLARPGNMTLVNFWATWCAPCRREMPELEKLARELEGNGLDVVGVSVDTGPAVKKVFSTARSLGVTYPVYTADEAAYPHLFAGEQVFLPLTYLVDREGRIVDFFSTWDAAAKERVRRAVGE